VSTAIKDLFDLGLHFGHLKRYLHPKNKGFIFSIINGVAIIDLEKTQEKLKEAEDFVKTLAKENKTLLFVGTKRQIGEIIKENAEEIKMPYIHKRFMGGTLTNFETVKKNLQKLQEMEKQLQEGQKLNKKERASLEKEYKKLQLFLGGLTKLEKLPDALFVVDVVKESNAVNEANRLGIPVIAILDTNGNPTKITYPIPGNDDSRKGVDFIVKRIVKAYKSVKERKQK
jgi:small subunit ribosomal protein S2